MAKKRSGSGKTKKENTKKTSSASRVCKNSKSNANETKNSRSSKARLRSTKREVKPTDDPLQRSTTNCDESKDVANKNGKLSFSLKVLLTVTKAIALHSVDQ